MSSVGRAIGLDVHLEFCEIAICEDHQVRSAGRIESTPEALAVLAASLLPPDQVALEVTGSSWEIVRILEPHVAKVTLVSPGDTGISHARAKTDRLDARTLARLWWAGELDAVWVPDEHTRVLRRRLSRREQLVRSRSRCKNEVHAVLMRRLKGRCPFSDMFGKAGREWLRGLELPVQECETIETAMRQSRHSRCVRSVVIATAMMLAHALAVLRSEKHAMLRVRAEQRPNIPTAPAISTLREQRGTPPVGLSRTRSHWPRTAPRERVPLSVWRAPHRRSVGRPGTRGIRDSPRLAAAPESQSGSTSMRALVVVLTSESTDASLGILPAALPVGAASASSRRC